MAAVVGRGTVIGVDDSALVHGLLGDLVRARPALVGTASIVTLVALTATAAAQGGHLRVRLFGGDLRTDATACTGPQAVRAVTATGCDVALVGGRLVGTDVWVPTHVRDGRHALLLAARHVYAVLAAGDPPAVEGDVDGWTRLAALTDFDGVLEVPGSPDPTAHPAAA